ncbi:MAG: HAD-IA family hydrolase [Pseudomonadota bacterium]
MNAGGVALDANFLARLKLVSWDVDGTLYPMRAVRLWTAWLALVTARGDDGTTIFRGAALRGYLRHRRAVELARAGTTAPGSPIAPDAGAATFVREILAPAIGRVGLRTGVAAALDALDARGVVQVIASDYGAAEKLAALGVAGRFRAAYAGDALGLVKPHPGMLARLAADFAVSADEMLHIGDRAATDGAAAAAFGCRCLLVGGRGGRALQALAAAVSASQVRG